MFDAQPLTFTAAELTLEPEIVMHGSPAITQRNLAIFSEHARAEQGLELDAAMATMHLDGTFQIFYAGGIDVHGFENVREFYRERMTVFAGRAAFAHRMIVTETYAIVHAWFKGAPKGNFFGHQTDGKPLFFPMTIWVYFKDGLVLGEAGYWDGDTVERQAREGATGDATMLLR